MQNFKLIFYADKYEKTYSTYRRNETASYIKKSKQHEMILIELSINKEDLLPEKLICEDYNMY